MTDALHETYEEMAAAYAVGALSVSELAAFEEHLAGCDACQSLAAQFSVAASALPISVPQVEAPDLLRSRVLAAVRGEAARTPAATRDARRFMFSPARFAVAASFIVALATASALLVWGLSLRDDLSSRDALLARSYESLSIMASAEARWEVRGTDAAPDAHGVVAYDEQKGKSSLVMWGLNEDPSLRYSVWVDVAGERSPVSRLYIADGGFWAVVRRDVRSLDGFGVTQIASDGERQVVLDASISGD